VSTRTTTIGLPDPDYLPKHTIAERIAHGLALRREQPHARHARWSPSADRSDSLQILERQSAARTPELVPIRYGRMSSSAFAFFRGGAAVMAADLATTPTGGLRAQLCGDAHLLNFGLANGTMLPENAAALVGAGMASVLVFPGIALAVRSRSTTP
jgi:hypothetical protein